MEKLLKAFSVRFCDPDELLLLPVRARLLPLLAPPLTAPPRRRRRRRRLLRVLKRV